MLRPFYDNTSMSVNPLINSLREKALGGAGVSRDEALGLSGSEGAGVFELFSAANAIRERFFGDRADLCSIVNAKSGVCTEDCAYCAQSKVSAADTEAYSLKDEGDILGAARDAKGNGARRFCIVTSGRRPGEAELERIAGAVAGVRALGLLPCATLGLLGEDELGALREAGLERYHCNLEASRRFFPNVCSTHTYDDKLATVRAARAVGLSVCSGGIFGMGETWEDRVDMAVEIRGLGAESVPINFLIPVPGTPLGGREPLTPLEALKVVSIYRFIMPEREIRLCGGRPQTLGELNSFVFVAGADGLLIGNYLTTQGREPEEDLELIKSMGMKPA